MEESARKSSRTRSIKKDVSHLEADDKKSEAVSSNRSKRSSLRDKYDEKSLKNIEGGRQVELKDRSCQYSRVTDPFQSSRTNEAPFQSIGDKNNSLIQHNEESINESSSFKHMIHNELKEERTQQIEETAGSPFKKKREESVKDNQSEKKSRSFIIHSRNGSVKEKSEKQTEKINHSQFSERKSHQKVMMDSSSIRSDSVTKEELGKLHEQIAFLREKLKKVEDRQEQMEKVESSLLKNRSSSEDNRELIAASLEKVEKPE